MVVVITTGSRTVEGAVQAGMAYAIIALVLALYLPTRLSGIEPILFAFGAMTYASHPEGIVEYQKSRWLARVGRLLQAHDERRARKTGPPVGEPRGAMDGLREALPAVSVPSGKVFGA